MCIRDRLYDIEEFEYDGRNAPEMTGTHFTLKLILDTGRIDIVLLRFRIKVALGRREQQINVRFPEFFAVGFKGARVFLEIFIRTELQTIDENARGNRLPVFARLHHQREVAIVQVTHGRDEDHAAMVSQGVAQVGNGGVNLHGVLCFLVERG